MGASNWTSVGAVGPRRIICLMRFGSSHGALAGRHILRAQFAFVENKSFTCPEKQFDLYHFGTTAAGFRGTGNRPATGAAT
jgi:hypothetical protein